MNKEKKDKINARDVFFFTGLLLIAGGMYLVWMPGALIVPGLILTAYAVFS